MIGLSLLSGLAALASLPGEVQAGGFGPCADANDAPALRGSLCVAAEAPLHPALDGSVGTVTLFVRKFPVVESRRLGEIWFVAGGPGESGAAFYPLLDTLRRAFPRHDLVMPDHRGTGYSTKLCPAEEAPDGPDGIALAGEEWGPCLGSLHENPERAHAFTITNAAHDLSGLIARYRGEGEVHVYGVSYGTQLVLRMMRIAPAELDGLVLDGLVPPESMPQWDLSRRTAIVDRVGRALLTADQAQAYQALLSQADAGWRNEVPGRNLRGFMGALLNFPELRDRIPAMVDELSLGETGLLARTAVDLQAVLAGLNLYPQSPPSLPLVMLISGSENNARRDLTRETVAEEEADALFTSPLPGLLVNPPVPLYDADAWFGRLPEALPKTLVVHGTLDPNTPYEGAQAHAEMLAGVGALSFTTVEGGAHILAFTASDCFVAAASAFVEGSAVPETCEFLPDP